MRAIDLSATIEQSPGGTPDFLTTEIAYHGHAEGTEGIENLFHVPPALLRDGEGWATETITRLGTHDSTHVDAPWHYNSRIQGGRAPTIDEFPPRVVLRRRGQSRYDGQGGGGSGYRRGHRAGTEADRV